MSRKLRSALLVTALVSVGTLVGVAPAWGVTITVNTTHDDPIANADPDVIPDGDCSLREAIFAADNDVAVDGCPAGNGPDTIMLGEDLTYLLDENSPISEEDEDRRGDLDIYQTTGQVSPRLLSISGAAAQPPAEPTLTIEGNGSIVDGSAMLHCNIFHVLGVSVVFNNLTIQGGGGFQVGQNNQNADVPRGGGILVEGEVSFPFEGTEGSAYLNNSVVRGNVAELGGGIYNDGGHVELANGSIVGDDDLTDEAEWGNIALDEGGGVYTVALPQQEPETLIVDASSIQANTALFDGGGIYNGGESVEETGDRVEIRNGSNVSANEAGAACFQSESGTGGNGGGIWTNARAVVGEGGVAPDSPGVFVNASIIDGNQVFSCGGFMEAGVGTGYGAGIYNENSGHVEILNGSVIGPDNEAAEDGGGIWTNGGRQRLSGTGSLLLDHSAVRDNTAGRNGGGIYSFFDSVDISHSEISGNTAEDGDGGGVWMEGQDFGEGFIGLVVGNTTISGNEALDIPEIGTSGLGGGIYHHGGPMFLDSVTLNDNRADVAGGNIALGINQASTAPTADIFNTIIARGFANELLQNCANDGGTFTSSGYNLSDDDATTNGCNLLDTTDILGEDPVLGGLQDNGGLTQTHALGSGSPAIDSGPTEGCPETDQRDVSRPQDGDGDGVAVCDRGAYERTPPELGGGGAEPPQVPERLCDTLGTTGDDILLGTDLGETICGLAGDDLIRAGGGADNLFGDPGDDRLIGGPADDAMVGGPGSDTGDYTDAPGSVDADLVRQTAVGEGASTDTLFELENLIGSAFPDVLRGDGGPNILKGKGSADVILGRGGDDFIRGAKGRDTLKGAGGEDVLKGGKSSDKVRGGAGNDTLTGGGQRPDDLRGNKGNDELRGGGGNDALDGGAGIDNCDGGYGTDTIRNCET